MTANTFTPHWTKLIARAWVDPSFKAELVADPATVLASFGIDVIAGRSISDFAGRIDVVDATSAADRPSMHGDRLELPFPMPPRDYDRVVTSGLESISAAGTSAYATEPMSGVPVAMGTQIEPRGDFNDFGDGSDGSSGDAGGIPPGVEVGPGPGVPAGSVDPGPGAATGGADAAADASAAAAYLCA